MELTNIDLGSIAVGITVITGLVNGIQLGFQKYAEGKANVEGNSVKGFVSFVLSLAFGLLFGFLNWFGLVGPEIGIVAGLASSGLYKFSQNIGGK